MIEQPVPRISAPLDELEWATSVTHPNRLPLKTFGVFETPKVSTIKRMTGPGFSLPIKQGIQFFLGHIKDGVVRGQWFTGHPLGKQELRTADRDPSSEEGHQIERKTDQNAEKGDDP